MEILLNLKGVQLLWKGATRPLYLLMRKGPVVVTAAILNVIAI